jgi:hypothetical protein
MPYAISQVTCELPYVLIQTVYYSLIVYAMVGFEWKAEKVTQISRFEQNTQ